MQGPCFKQVQIERAYSRILEAQNATERCFRTLADHPFEKHRINDGNRRQRLHWYHSWPIEDYLEHRVSVSSRFEIPGAYFLWKDRISAGNRRRRSQWSSFQVRVKFLACILTPSPP